MSALHGFVSLMSSVIGRLAATAHGASQAAPRWMWYLCRPPAGMVRQLGIIPGYGPKTDSFARDTEDDTATVDELRPQREVLRVGLIGVPNAGKSLLANQLVGKKVSAVSPRINTTVCPSLGAFVEGHKQVVLQDTPGFVSRHEYRDQKHGRRVASALATASFCHLLVFVIDAGYQIKRPKPSVESLARVLSTSGQRQNDAVNKNEEIEANSQLLGRFPPCVLALNKVDMVPPSDASKLDELELRMSQLHSFHRTFQMSALTGYGVDALRTYLLAQTRPGEWECDEQEFTNRGTEDIALEVVREQLFNCLFKELPYRLELEHTGMWTGRRGQQMAGDGGAAGVAGGSEPEGAEGEATLFLGMQVMVQRKPQRGILLGKAGSRMAQVERAAGHELSELLRRPVRVHVTVKVRD